jgi:hypothetical protein
MITFLDENSSSPWHLILSLLGSWNTDEIRPGHSTANLNGVLLSIPRHFSRTLIFPLHQICVKLLCLKLFYNVLWNCHSLLVHSKSALATNYPDYPMPTTHTAHTQSCFPDSPALFPLFQLPLLMVSLYSIFCLLLKIGFLTELLFHCCHLLTSHSLLTICSLPCGFCTWLQGNSSIIQMTPMSLNTMKSFLSSSYFWPLRRILPLKTFSFLPPMTSELLVFPPSLLTF